jgi:hypothetical protein
VHCGSVLFASSDFVGNNAKAEANSGDGCENCAPL